MAGILETSQSESNCWDTGQEAAANRRVPDGAPNFRETPRRAFRELASETFIFYGPGDLAEELRFGPLRLHKEGSWCQRSWAALDFEQLEQPSNLRTRDAAWLLCILRVTGTLK